MNVNPQKPKKATKKVQAAFEQFLQVISTPQGRQDFTETPDVALGPTAAKDLPDELKGFLEALSVGELALLYRLCERTTAAGLYETYGNITVSHL